MRFELITLFPDYFRLLLQQSLIGKAQEKGIFEVRLIDLRSFALDKHRTVDDTPFGGGGGMVMKVEPLDLALRSLGWQHGQGLGETDRLILTSAAGRPFRQELAIEYSLCERVTIICGHYLGVDERITQLFPVEEVSIGDYVLTGGEPAAAVLVDAIGRLIPKVLGNICSALEDSHMNQLVGSPCYTKPAVYDGLAVPEELLSGNHAEIARYRREAAIEKCYRYRPELLERTELTTEEHRFVNRLRTERSEKKNIKTD